MFYIKKLILYEKSQKMTKFKMAAVSLENCIYRHKKEPKLKKYTNIFDIS